MTDKYFCDEFFDKLESLALNLPTTLTGYYGGKHKINKYGHTVEFADFREYEPGDDIRRIDWNLYARLGKYFLRLYTDERQMHIRIYIDCSESMGYYPEKGEYALGLAMAFGYLAVRNNDKVTFHFIRNGTSYNPFGLIVGKTAFFSAASKMKNVTFGGEANFADTIPNIPETGTNDGLAVLISDFLMDSSWQKAANYLRYKKQQILLCQVLSQEEISPTFGGKLNLIDCEGAGLGDGKNVQIAVNRSVIATYKKELAKHMAEIKQFCNRNEMTFMASSPKISVEKLIFRELSRYDIIR